MLRISAVRGIHPVIFLLATLMWAPLTPAAAQNPATTSTVWLADHQHLHRINPSNNQFDLTVALDDEVEALAMDPANHVWVLAEKQLIQFDNNGQFALKVDLKNLTDKLDDPKNLVLSPYDASLWIAGEKVFLHLDSQGQLLGKGETSNTIQSLNLDNDESLWLLTHKELRHLSKEGATLRRIDVTFPIQDPKHLAVDSLGGLVWLAGKNQLWRLELNHLDLPAQKISLPSAADDDDRKILALALDPLLGSLWVATKQNLFIYDREAKLLTTLNLTAPNVGGVQTLLFEPISASFWLGGKKAVARFHSTGDFIARIAADENIDALGVAPFYLTPTLSLIEPQDDSRTNNSRPPIRLGLASSCNMIPCLLPDAYIQSLSLDVNLNGQAIGPLFSRSTRNEALYIPPSRLPEGLNILNAQATDLFGHSSSRLSSRFTVDTIAPKFLSIRPAEGSLFTAAAITIQGSLDDATAHTTLLDAAGQVISMANGANFSFAVNLNPGLNTFSLIARDPAGNETKTVLHLTYASITITLANPQPNANLASTSLEVNGHFQGPPNTGITVNGVVAMIYGDQYYANLDLAPGVNTLTVIATTPDGTSVTQTITVTVTANTPDPIHVAVSPQSGVAPLPVQFTVDNSSGLGIQRIEADLDGDGTTDFTSADPTAPIAYTYPSPGVYRASFQIADSQNIGHRQTLVVVVNDAAQRDKLFTSLWNGMNDALKIGNVNAALSYLNESAKRKYQPVFETLKAQFPPIIASYSPLRRISITESIGEYAIVRNFNGQNRLYLIYFLQDADGVWRVEGM